MCSRRDIVNEIVSSSRESISLHLRQMIAAKGQKRTAELCGLSRQQIDRWLKRGSPINLSLEHLIAMSVGMATPVQVLLGLERRVAATIDSAELDRVLKENTERLRAELEARFVARPRSPGWPTVSGPRRRDE